MDNDNRIIRFDWAVKRMLRDKANFDVLEGLMKVLIGEDLRIEEILESGSNQETADDKFNRVDIKAKNQNGDIIIVEVQLTREIHYLERILYGMSKAITEHIALGSKYDKVKKVYSINILYFELGKGKDYLYHGTTTFKGVHTDDYLEVGTREKGAIKMRTPTAIFPEYYLIRVNEFNSVAKTPIEEWLDYLKNDHIRPDTNVPGLQEARKKLAYLKMSEQERQAYDRNLKDIMTQNDLIDAAREEGLSLGWKAGLSQGRKEGIEEGILLGREEGWTQGRNIGRAEGREEGRPRGRELGRAEERMAIARKLLTNGISIDIIKTTISLTDDEINLLNTLTT